MKRLSSLLLLCIACIPASGQTQKLSMSWGLQNTWSYYETARTLEQDASYHPEGKGRKYRTFAFAQGKNEVLQPMLDCFQRHEKLWREYQQTLKKGELQPPPIAAGSIKTAERRAFSDFKAQRDLFCVKQAEKQAPELYFDFIAHSADQYVLKQIEITTLDFSEYRGGGFFKEEAGYDVVLSHKKGKKTIQIEKKLVFAGTGRIQLRLWSDNYYPQVGWLAPMGEYFIDIRFVFMVGGETVTVTTGPFKIDV